MKWIFSAARHISRLLTLSMVLRHMRPVSGTCLLAYLLALHQFGSGFKKLGAHMISISINLLYLYTIVRFAWGKQNCHMPWLARHLMNRFCRPLLPIIRS
jgi:hypothetical protein